MDDEPSYFQKAGPDLPVERVSRDEALEFCRRVSERERKEGRLPAGYEYTLPTEAQWEYACRAGGEGSCAGDSDQSAWYAFNSGRVTHIVGQKSPNAWGFLDMAGNVMEWCFDAYAPYGEGDLADPLVPMGRDSLGVVRGGSWDSTAGGCRPTYRYFNSPALRSERIGFRLALVPVRP
jgi:formylglycine-generating enzyme required for sulfatase activity